MAARSFPATLVSSGAMCRLLNGLRAAALGPPASMEAFARVLQPGRRQVGVVDPVCIKSQEQLVRIRGGVGYRLCGHAEAIAAQMRTTTSHGQHGARDQGDGGRAWLPPGGSSPASQRSQA